MPNNKEEKQYGLILPKKQQYITPKVNNVFGDNNDSDEEDGTDWVKRALQAEGEKNKMKKQTKLNMQKALKEDPTIFQYDEVYDDIERIKDQSKTAKDEKKKPRYIQNLLKAAERRKKEQEYRIERMVQKEREAEGTMYADKESFVTSAYRAKLEEFKRMEEEENKMDRLEAIADVKKQQDMSGFYRHLYVQTIQSPEKLNVKNNISSDKTNLDNNLENVNKEAENKEQIKSKEVKKNRQYRQRIIEEDSDIEIEIEADVLIEQTLQNKAKIILPEKRKDIEEEPGKTESGAKKQKQQTEDIKPEEIKSNEVKIEKTLNTKNVEQIVKNCKNDDETERENISAKAKIEAEKKERSKIWEKRTIGPVFEAALQRYYVRKSMRLSTV
ncbi:Nuclear speckle splicing regulatory protein 1 [Eufriesea mexicana]|uniref:Nuclear speckle splicing regulatory protein 1 n=1 Tax=Eufriesea mexicana TaxID=516756 RepID=A0A310SV94_9HYME|nr:PREDICTED: nuclear speckle splicing regulatory protein 1 [Eufriesea mexicana]OAD62353.1 Nuclear speckle splicing regulatory protein 1 [Eufriesea mexicana]